MLHIAGSLTTPSETAVSTMLDVSKLLTMLNEALAAEIIATIQYKIGAIIVRGTNALELVAQMEDHAKVEFEHSSILLKRINELGGVPTTDIIKLVSSNICPYAEPTSSDLAVILNQSLEGEQCAIRMYSKIAEYVNGRDHVTYELITGILADEQEHERDFITMKENLSI